jgi:indolepyruvate decarboxylase
VTSCGEFDEALSVAARGDQAAYIEVVTGTYDAPALLNKLHDSVKTLYNLA